LYPAYSYYNVSITDNKKRGKRARTLKDRKIRSSYI
jgi:hypothetical protein